MSELRTLAIQLFAHPRDQFRRGIDRIHIITVNDDGSHCVALNFMKCLCNHFAGEVAWPPRGRRPAGFTSEARKYCSALRGFLVIDYSVCFRSSLLVRFGKLRWTEFEGQLFDHAV